MPFQIWCDFDGTIAVEDVTDVLLEQFALPAWRALEADWRAGQIGSRECMARQVDLLRLSPAQLDACLDRLEIDPAFPGFVATALALGCEVAVISDGIDYAIRRVLSRFGLARLPVYANHLESLGGDRWRLTSPHAAHDCRPAAGTCKCRIATGAPTPRLRIMIGDGTSDFCVSHNVDLVFAKGKLATYCRGQNIPHVAIHDFTEATAHLTALDGKFIAQVSPSL